MVIYAIIITLLLAALIRQLCLPADPFSSMGRYYLSGNGDWGLLPGTMAGASATADGATGLVPAPLLGKQGAYLRGDGTWQQSSSIPPAAQYLMATSNKDLSAPAKSIVILPDILSASGTAITATPAGFVLQENCTYKCTVQFPQLVGGSASYVDYIWYNVTTGRAFGEGGGISSGNFYAMAVGYITTTAPTTIGIYITFNNTPNPTDAIVRGNTNDVDPGFPGVPPYTGYQRGPWAIIEMVSNNSIINMPVAIPPASSVACQGVLSSVVVLAGGTLYASSAPTVTIAPPPPGGIPATAQAIISDGAVVAIILTSSGAGYTADPLISIGPPQSGGTQAAAIAYAVTTGLESPSNCGNLVGTTSGSAYIIADGSVRVLGRNQLGCQGLGTSDINNTTPVPIMWAETGWVAPPAVRIWAAYANKYVLGADGYLYGTGKNDQGGLGLGHTSTAFMLSRILLPIGLVKFACSNGVTANPSCLALLGNGQLYGWGRNATGELGLGHTNIVTTPTRIPIGAQYAVAEIYCVGGSDKNVSYLLLSNGQVMAAGTNTFAQCGNARGATQSIFGIMQSQQHLYTTYFGFTKDPMPTSAYSATGDTYVTSVVFGSTPTVRVLKASTYVIDIPAMSNYNLGGYPTVNINKNGSSIASYTFPSTGNVGSLVASAAFAAGDTITITTTTNVNQTAFTISLVRILTGITQIAVSGADAWTLAAFFNAAAGTCHYTGYTPSMGPNIPLTTYAALWKNTIGPADPPVAIFASGNSHGGSYGAANMAVITAAGNLWSWGYTCLRPVAPDTQPFPGLSWSAGGVRKVCLYSYMNNAVGVILLKNGEIYYNGISKGVHNAQVSPHYRSASDTTADTGGNWVRSYLHRRDIVDITMTGDTYNPNVQVLTSTGEVYISGFNLYGQLGVGDTQEGRLVFARARF